MASPFHRSSEQAAGVGAGTERGREQEHEHEQEQELNHDHDHEREQEQERAPAIERGWLFDLYPRGDRIVLWIIADSGERLRLTVPFSPSFYLAGLARAGLTQRALAAYMASQTPGLALAGVVERTDFWTGQPRRVLEIRVADLDAWAPNVRKLFRRWPDLEFFNCDILPEIVFGYETRLFPTCRLEFRRRGDDLIDARALDDSLSTDYEPPPLRQAEITALGDLAGRAPRLHSLTYTMDGESITWDGESGSGSPSDSADIIASLNARLRRDDPDLIWSRGGDSAVIPALLALAAAAREPLALDREPDIRRALQTDGRTFVSYGRVLYHAPDYPLYGRWHIDRENSFWAAETGLAGLIETSRLSRIPVQRAARRSIGTGISAVQLDLAWRDGFLIPWKKTRPEDWKSAATLLKSDRGGLVYQPITGVYEDVVELDFVSMYPSIMVRRNVSPETLNCACCEPNNAVPELGYTICEKRRGLIPRALEPIIAKRNEYKRLRGLAKKASKAKTSANSAEGADRRSAPQQSQNCGADLRSAPTSTNTDPAELYTRFDGRQSAIKWMLVTCFGYLGYRNARFGRIEAHETTCAWSRELLLRAREICEDRGFRVLHAIVDCVWLHKPGVSPDEVAALCREIDEATDLTIAIEGRYRWLAFLPSREDPDTPVPNRYFGVFDDGSLKFRGVELRRSDQPLCARNVQRALLDRLAALGGLAEIRAARDELLEIVREAEGRLRRGEAPVAECAMTRKTSREAAEYRGNNPTAVAARQAKRAGINLHAGQSISYIVARAGDPDPDTRVRLLALLRPEEGYDGDFYAAQVRSAAATLLEPLLGESLEMALGPIGPPRPMRRKPRQAAAGRKRPRLLE